VAAKRKPAAKPSASAAAQATKRVIRIPGPSNGKLPAAASAMQADENAPQDGEGVALAEQPTGLKRFMPKFLR
jgi:hypothetical protein